MPALVNVRSLKTALPPETVRVVMPDRLAPDGPLWIDSRSVSLLSVVTRLPRLSNKLTATAGLNNTPATLARGCTAKPIRLIAAGLTTKLGDEIIVSPGCVALRARNV